MKRIFIAIISILFCGVMYAQHEHHPPPTKPAPKTIKKAPAKKTVKQQPKKDTTMMQHDMHTMKADTVPHDMHGEHDEMMMPSHSFSRNLPMSRNGSGTAWNPDATPMYMWMESTDKTDWMFHGSVFMRYTNTDIFSSGSRGDDAISFPNWFMAMMNRKIGERGLFNATAMISLDRLTEGGDGYPLLFQSGETWKGKRLVDRQHPHDLFSGLSIGYTQMFNENIDLFAYLGYPGEPALGAPAFMHRISTMNNPDAPLGHHWQDATHITFGVGTLGFRFKNFKAEGSIFTGREPDENRYDFDKPRFDSYSYRLSLNPTENWALQFSQGFIESPEALEPGEDVTRTSASVLYAKKLKMHDHFTAAAIWGLNKKHDDHKEHSFLFEGNYQFMKNVLYGRYEYLQKSKEELDLDGSFPDKNFNIHALTAGYNRTLKNFCNIDLVAGTQFTIHGVDKSLQNLYGKRPVSFQLYLQFRPSLHKH